MVSGFQICSMNDENDERPYSNLSNYLSGWLSSIVNYFPINIFIFFPYPLENLVKFLLACNARCCVLIVWVDYLHYELRRSCAKGNCNIFLEDGSIRLAAKWKNEVVAGRACSCFSWLKFLLNEPLIIILSLR